MANLQVTPLLIREANPANACVARSLRSSGRQPQTGKVQCQALQCGDHQLLASLLEGLTGTIFLGSGLKGWLKGDFTPLVCLGVNDMDILFTVLLK